jgi:hypothetical protein
MEQRSASYFTRWSAMKEKGVRPRTNVDDGNYLPRADSRASKPLLRRAHL